MSSRTNDNRQPTRAQLRSKYRSARRSLAKNIQRQNSLCIIKRLLTHLKFNQSQHVGLYWPMDGEPDLLGICRSNKSWYLPIISDAIRPYEPSRLLFQPFTPGQGMVKNRFQIPEPPFDPGRQRSAMLLDILLMPLVAFDTSGNRLGMGGGYYDRSLAKFKQNYNWHKPRLVGVAHSIQATDKILKQHWDIPLDAIVTEKGIIHVTGRF